MSGDEAAGRLHRQLLFLTLALAGGVVTFGVVVAGLYLAGREPAMPLEPSLRIGVVVLGVALLGAAQLVGQALARPAPGATAASAETAEKIRTAVIVAMGMRESVGLLGSVVGLLTGELLLMSALVAASAATMIFGVPGRDEVENRLRRRQG